MVRAADIAGRMTWKVGSPAPLAETEMAGGAVGHWMMAQAFAGVSGRG